MKYLIIFLLSLISISSKSEISVKIESKLTNKTIIKQEKQLLSNSTPHYPFELKMLFHSISAFSFNKEEMISITNLQRDLGKAIQSLPKESVYLLIKSEMFKYLFDTQIDLKKTTRFSEKSIQELSIRKNVFLAKNNLFLVWISEAVQTDLWNLSANLKFPIQRHQLDRKTVQKIDLLSPWYSLLTTQKYEDILGFARPIIHGMLEELLLKIQINAKFSSLEMKELPMANTEKKIEMPNVTDSTLTRFQKVRQTESEKIMDILSDKKRYQIFENELVKNRRKTPQIINSEKSIVKDRVIEKLDIETQWIPR
ncbi:hypothetical protein OAB57_00755 [Bacteriovoracaceae bacterium]|nr:hypothetical protein [Bacteriovoracaceae bacterium]